MYQHQIDIITGTSRDGAEAMNELVTSYEEVAEMADKAIKAVSFLDSARGGELKDLSAVKSAQEFVDIYNELLKDSEDFKEIDVGDIISVSENGFEANTDAIASYTEQIVRATLANSQFVEDFKKANPEATEEEIGAFVDHLVAYVQKGKDATEDLGSVLTQFKSINDWGDAIKEYRSGAKTAFEMLQDAVSLASQTDGIELKDLIKVSGGKIDFSDIADVQFDRLIAQAWDKFDEDTKTALGDLETFKNVVKESIEEVGNLGSALSGFKGMSDWNKAVKEYRDGARSAYDMLQDAVSLAESNEGVNLGDLIRVDDKGLNFSTISDYKMDAFIRQAWDSFDEGTRKSLGSLEDFTRVVKEAVKETGNLGTALSGFQSMADWGKSITEYKNGVKSAYDMMQEAVALAESTEGVSLSDLMSVGADGKLFFRDIGNYRFDKLLESAWEGFDADTQKALGTLENFKNIVKETTKEVGNLGTALSNFKSMSDWNKSISEYRQGTKTAYDMLQDAVSLAENTEGINLSDLIKVENGKVDFSQLYDFQIDRMLTRAWDSFDEKTQKSLGSLEEFKQVVKDSIKEVGNFGSALSNFKPISDWNRAIDEYKNGTRTAYEMMEEAASLAANTEGVDLKDLIKVSGGKIDFSAISNFRMDRILTNMWNSFDAETKKIFPSMEEFIELMKASREEVGDLGEALSGFKGMSDWNKSIKEYQSGARTAFDMLQEAVSLAESNDSVNLSDLIRVTDGRLDFRQLYDYQLDRFLASAWENFDEQTKKSFGTLEQFRDLVKASTEEVGNLGSALSGFKGMTEWQKSVEDYKSGVKSMYEMLEDAISLAENTEGIDLDDLIRVTDGQIDFTKLYNFQMDKYLQTLWDSFGQRTKDIFGDFESFKNIIHESTEETKSLTGAVQDLLDVMNFQSRIGQTVDFTTVFDDLDTLKRIFKDDSLDITDLIRWEDGDYKYIFDRAGAAHRLAVNMATELVEAEIASGVAIDDRVAAIEERANRIQESLFGAAQAWDQMTSTVSNIQSLQGLKENYEDYLSGDMSLIEMLSEAAPLAKELGLTLDDVLEVASDGSVVLNIDAIEDGLISMIDRLEASGEISAYLAAQMREAARAETKAATAAQRIQKAYENASANVAFGENLTRGQQLTYGSYTEMIERDARYADSIEYVNGVLAVNRDRYYEITEAIAEETAETALLEAARRKLEIEEYQHRLKTEKDLTDDARKSMEQHIKRLQAEANGYLILANEISNATNQFNRFRNAVGDPSPETYMDVQSAMEIIENVLYNAESDLYGQIGNEKFQEAFRLVVDPDFEFTDGNFDEAYQRVKERLNKYFGKGNGDNQQTLSANMSSFWEDLLAGGFATEYIDDAGRKWGQLDGTVEDIAKKFGVTKDVIRAALQQLEKFSGVKFDWEHIDPEYYEEVIAKAEEAKAKAEEAQQKAVEAEAAARKAREEADAAAAAYEQAKASGDKWEAAGAHMAAAVAEANAKAAEEDATKARKAADEAIEKVSEQKADSATVLKQTVSEVLETIETIKNTPIEIDASAAIESTKSVIDNLTEIIRLINDIKLINLSFENGGNGGGGGNGGTEGRKRTGREADGRHERSVKGNTVRLRDGGASGDITQEYHANVRLETSLDIQSTDGLINEDGTINTEKVAERFVPEGYSGNVDLTNRKPVPIQMLTDVGWYNPDGTPLEGDYATLFTNTFSAGDTERGFDVPYDMNVVCNITPILADGTVLSEDELWDYINQIVGESTDTGKSITEVDAEHLSLILSVDVVEEGDDLGEAYERAGEWAERLHELQAEWDEIRFENHLFDDGWSQQKAELTAFTDAAQEAIAAAEALDAQSIDIDTKDGEENVQELKADVNATDAAVDRLDGSTIGLNTRPASQNLYTLMNQLASVAQSVNNLNGQIITIGTKYTNGGSSGGTGGGASGPSGASGIPSARGGRTLVGELGREMVVDVNTGRWYTVGNHGPEMIRLPKQAIVYNHEKTEELLGTKKLDLSGLSMAAGTKANSAVTGGMINLDAFTKTVEQNTKSTSRAASAAEEEVNILDEIAERFDKIIGLLEHQIEHAEFEYFNNERSMDYRGMIDALQGEAEIYRQIYQNAMEGVQEMAAAGATDADEPLQELEEHAWDAYRSMKDALDKVRTLVKDALNDEVDNIQKATKTLEEAADQYNESGGITVDTLQSIIDNGVQYIGFLQDENGQFVLNTDAVEKLTNARKEQLAVETALSYIDRLRESLRENETQTLRSLIDANNDMSGSTWGMVYANLALAKSEGLTQEQYEIALQNIDRLRELTALATDGITASAEDRAASIKEAFEKLDAEIDHYIAHQEQAYREGERAWEFDNMEKALENEIGYYQRIAEEAQRAIDEMKRLGLDDTNESLQAMEEALWNASNSMYDTIDKLRSLRVTAIGNEIGALSSAYGALKSAADEYNQSGRMSVDTFQSILNNGVQYLSLLDRENDQYVISRDRISDYIRARKEQLAIETALKYISEIREAAQRGESERVAKLTDATNGLSRGTWDLVYAQAALLRETGLSSEQYDRVLDNINKLRDLAQNVETDLTKAEEDITEAYQSQLEALNDILKYTEDLIRAETKDRIDAIEEEIEAYKEIIDLKKESLKTTKEENDYQDEVADKVKEIAELQAKADLLALDTSRSASAQRQKLLQEIQDKQTELNEYQADHAYDAQVEALEKEAEAYEESRQDEIEALEKSVSSEEKVYQLAIARIRDQWDTLYADLIAWNTEQGTVINQEITDAWEEALKAVQRYGNYLSALSGLEADINGLNSNGNLVVADIPKYHGGGVAGDRGKLNDEEVLAILKKGELVVDREQKKGLYTVVDIVKTLGDRLGTTIGNLKGLTAFRQMMPSLAGLAAPASAESIETNNITFSPTFSVTIGGEVSDRASAMEYGRTLAQTAADSLFDAFSRRGIGALRPLRQ